MKKSDFFSAQAVMPVMVRFGPPGELRTAIGYVSYGQDMVWFPHDQELNTDDMRRAVLATLDTELPDVPVLPPELLAQVEQVRSGDYGKEYHDLTGATP